MLTVGPAGPLKVAGPQGISPLPPSRRAWEFTYECMHPISPRRRGISADLHAEDTLFLFMHASFFLHTQMTTQAGSLVYVQYSL